ncbi:hypothetical protein [Streptomyces violascens]|uniref:hypothetical protein n=1 Tax=Streptomyces violascens TaxID=67381 RepID=UPI0036BD356A
MSTQKPVLVNPDLDSKLTKPVDDVWVLNSSLLTVLQLLSPIGAPLRGGGEKAKRQKPAPFLLMNCQMLVPNDLSSQLCASLPSHRASTTAVFAAGVGPDKHLVPSPKFTIGLKTPASGLMCAAGLGAAWSVR